MKTAIVRKNGELIHKNESRFDLLNRVGYFPFKELRRSNKAYFISELDLFDFFQATEETLSDYSIDYYPNWNFEAKESFLNLFLDGYQFGLENFNENIGLSFPSLSYDHKVEHLRNFCLYCLDYLYFDAELDEALFYNLGYLQSNLYLAFIELNNLQKLSKENNSYIKVKTHTEPKNQSDKYGATSQDHPAEHKTTTETKNSHSPERIEIYCDVAEIKKIWQVLTAPISTGKGMEQPLFTKDELGKYLGAMFCSGAFPDAFKSSVEPELKTISRGDMRNVLIALMYSCYSLNRNFFRGSNQIMYVAMLKRYFSAFATSKIESTKSILATYTPKGMDVLKNSLDKNPHIDEMLSILKKHKLRH
ncbi:MAG: hypothetical protein EOO43_03030 [Flavobacterium sp.]|nr:MAG: hypothetical protein EOO43_03030 [Flavobacterium sp.]